MLVAVTRKAVKRPHSARRGEGRLVRGFGWWKERQERLRSHINTKGEDDAERRYFEDSIPILGFLGGVALAALVLLLQEKLAIEAATSDWYFQIIVGYLAMVSVLCVIACSLCQRAVANWVRRHSTSWNSAYWLHNIAYATFLLALPMVLVPFAWEAALVVLVLGSIIGYITVVRPILKGENLPPPQEQKA